MVGYPRFLSLLLPGTAPSNRLEHLPKIGQFRADMYPECGIEFIAVLSDKYLLWLNGRCEEPQNTGTESRLGLELLRTVWNDVERD